MLTMYASYLRMKLSPLVKSEKGQGLVEYALILALISVVLIASLNSVEGGIAGAFTSIVNALTGA